MGVERGGNARGIVQQRGVSVGVLIKTSENATAGGEREMADGAGWEVGGR